MTLVSLLQNTFKYSLSYDKRTFLLVEAEKVSKTLKNFDSIFIVLIVDNFKRNFYGQKLLQI